MAKISDREQRVGEIIDLVLEIVARDGLAAATTRRIAKEGGFTSGLLSHYFTTKEEMINFAFEAIAERIFRRIGERIAVATNLRDKVRAMVEEVLPLDGHQIEAVLSIVFWNSAIHDDKLRKLFRRSYSQWRTGMHRLLEEAIRSGELRGSGDLELRVDVANAAMDGFILSWILQPDRCSKADRKRRVDAILAMILSPSNIDP